VFGSQVDLLGPQGGGMPRQVCDISSQTPTDGQKSCLISGMRGREGHQEFQKE
jgi:hypothetical protein